MGVQAEVQNRGFAPHPGRVAFRSMWNHSETVESADQVPDTNKFIYYDNNHMETADHAKAASRVPIVEVEMNSIDREGKLVEPTKATRITISEYGPKHQELRHSSGPGPAR